MKELAKSLEKLTSLQSLNLNIYKLSMEKKINKLKKKKKAF